MRQAIKNSDIMTEYDRHAAGKFRLGILVGIAGTMALFALGLFISTLIYV